MTKSTFWLKMSTDLVVSIYFSDKDIAIRDMWKEDETTFGKRHTNCLI